MENFIVHWREFLNFEILKINVHETHTKNCKVGLSKMSKLNFKVFNVFVSWNLREENGEALIGWSRTGCITQVVIELSKFCLVPSPSDGSDSGVGHHARFRLFLILNIHKNKKVMICRQAQSHSDLLSECHVWEQYRDILKQCSVRDEVTDLQYKYWYVYSNIYKHTGLHATGIR